MKQTASKSDKQPTDEQLQGNQHDKIIKALDVLHTFVQSILMDLAAAPKKIARMKKAKSAEHIAQELNLPVSWVEKYML